MSEGSFRFKVDAAPRIHVKIRSGDITVRASKDGTVAVDLDGSSEVVDETTVEAISDSVTVRTRSHKHRWFSRSMDIDIAAPSGSSVRIHLASGDVNLHVPLKFLEINAASGDVVVGEEVGEAQIKVGSGDVFVAKVDDCSIRTASGGIEVGEAVGIVIVKTASGDIKIRKASGRDVHLTSMSGDITVGLVQGLKIDARVSALSGVFSNEITPSSMEKTSCMSLVIKSFSGDVRLRSPW